MFTPMARLCPNKSPKWFTFTFRHHLHLVHSYVYRTARLNSSLANVSKLEAAESLLKDEMIKAKIITDLIVFINILMSPVVK